MTTRAMVRAGCVAILAMAVAGAGDILAQSTSRPAGLPAGCEMRFGGGLWLGPRGSKSVAVSPDAAYVAVGGHDGIIRVFDARTQKLVRTLEGLGGEPPTISALTFNADGSRLAAASWAGAGAAWEWPSGKLVGKYPTTPLKIMIGGQPMVTNLANAVAFGADGKTLALGGDSSTVDLISLPSGARTGLQLPEAPDPSGVVKRLMGIDALAFSPDGKKLAVGCRGPVVVFDLATSQPDVVTERMGHDATCLAYSKDGSMLAAGVNDRPKGITTLAVWKTEDGTAVGSQTGVHVRGIRGLAFMPDGKSLFTSGGDGTGGGYSIRQWSVPGLTKLRQYQTTCQEMGLSADGKLLASAFTRLAMWDAVSGRSLTGGVQGRLSMASFSRDGRQVLLGDGDQMLRVWNLDDGSLAAEVAAPGPLTAPYQAGFAADGKGLWAIAAKQLERNMVVFARRSYVAAASQPDAAWEAFPASPEKVHYQILTVCGNGQLAAGGQLVGKNAFVALVWNLATGEAVGRVGMTFRPHGNNPIGDLRLSSNGRYLVQYGLAPAGQSGRSPFVAVAYEVATGKELRRVETPPTHVAWGSAAVSDNGELMATGGFDRVVRVWRVSDGKKLAEFTGHQDLVSMLAFSPDGKRLVSGGYDGLGFLWTVPAK